MIESANISKVIEVVSKFSQQLHSYLWCVPFSMIVLMPKNLKAELHFIHVFISWVWVLFATLWRTDGSCNFVISIIVCCSHFLIVSITSYYSVMPSGPATTPLWDLLQCSSSISLCKSLCPLSGVSVPCWGGGYYGTSTGANASETVAICTKSNVGNISTHWARTSLQWNCHQKLDILISVNVGGGVKLLE